MVGLASRWACAAERISEPDELAEKVAAVAGRGDGPRLFASRCDNSSSTRSLNPVQARTA